MLWIRYCYAFYLTDNDVEAKVTQPINGEFKTRQSLSLD